MAQKAEGRWVRACTAARWPMHATQVSEEQAKAIAQKYVDEQLKGYTIEKVIPSSGMPRTMYTVEAPGLPKRESKTLHISPFGHVMPFLVPQAPGLISSVARRRWGGTAPVRAVHPTRGTGGPRTMHPEILMESRDVDSWRHGHAACSLVLTVRFEVNATSRRAVERRRAMKRFVAVSVSLAHLTLTGVPAIRAAEQCPPEVAKASAALKSARPPSRRDLRPRGPSRTSRPRAPRGQKSKRCRRRVVISEDPGPRGNQDVQAPRNQDVRRAEPGCPGPPR